MITASRASDQSCSGILRRLQPAHAAVSLNTDLDGERENDVDLREDRLDVFGHVDLGHTRVAVVHRPAINTRGSRHCKLLEGYVCRHAICSKFNYARKSWRLNWWGIPPDLRSGTSCLRSTTSNNRSCTSHLRSGTFFAGIHHSAQFIFEYFSLCMMFSKKM